jgi:hypothetical protein
MGFAILLLSAVVLVTFVHKYDNSRPILQESFQQVPINYSDLKNLKGNIISLQNNESGLPAWIVSGRWKMIDAPGSNLTANTLFSANLTTVSIYGTDENKYRLSEFKISDSNLKNRTATIRGLITMTTLGEKTSRSVNPTVTEIPITLKIFNVRTIMIKIDQRIKTNISNYPIFGTVTDQG